MQEDKTKKKNRKTKKKNKKKNKKKLGLSGDDMVAIICTKVKQKVKDGQAGVKVQVLTLQSSRKNRRMGKQMGGDRRTDKAKNKREGKPISDDILQRLDKGK